MCFDKCMRVGGSVRGADEVSGDEGEGNWIGVSCSEMGRREMRSESVILNLAMLWKGMEGRKEGSEWMNECMHACVNFDADLAGLIL